MKANLQKLSPTKKKKLFLMSGPVNSFSFQAPYFKSSLLKTFDRQNSEIRIQSTFSSVGCLIKAVAYQGYTYHKNAYITFTV